MSQKRIKQIVAFLALLIITFGMYNWLMPDKDWQGIKVVSGQRDSVTLPDGSMAFIIGPSTLGYPKSFTEAFRRIKMEGEIYFEIANESKPFLVQSEKGGVETNGATFVMNTQEEENITVHCLRDNLRMIARGKTKNFEIGLGANEKCAFWRSDKIISKDSFTQNIAADFNL